LEPEVAKKLGIMSAIVSAPFLLVVLTLTVAAMAATAQEEE